MLAIRIIPTMLHRRGTLVKGIGFDSWRSVGYIQQAAEIHARRGVDELIILDIGATPSATEPDYAMVASITHNAFIPITVGGGVSKLEHVRQLLLAGADKVSINSAYELIPEASSRYGSQAIVASVDVKDGQVVTHCGSKPTGADPVLWAMQLERMGAGEILLCNVKRDGTMQGYDLDLIRRVADAVGIPVVASGGCSGYDDMYHAIKAGASAVAAGALFIFEDATPRGAAEYLKEKGMEVRT